MLDLMSPAGNKVQGAQSMHMHPILTTQTSTTQTYTKEYLKLEKYKIEKCNFLLEE